MASQTLRLIWLDESLLMHIVLHRPVIESVQVESIRWVVSRQIRLISANLIGSQGLDIFLRFHYSALLIVYVNEVRNNKLLCSRLFDIEFKWLVNRSLHLLLVLNLILKHG